MSFNIQIKKNKTFLDPKSLYMILSSHNLLPFPKHAHSLTFCNILFVFLYNDISIHASPNNRVWPYSFLNFEWNQHVYTVLCLASFTQCCFHNSAKLCVAVVHSFSLLHSILWICHNFPIIDGIFGSRSSIMKHSSMNLLSHVLWCMCTWFFLWHIPKNGMTR